MSLNRSAARSGAVGPDHQVQSALARVLRHRFAAEHAGNGEDDDRNETLDS
jgi:hypothetical protein